MSFNISDYLKKFQNFLPFESRVKSCVITAVQEIVGVPLNRSKIAVSGDKVFITGSSALKAEIAVKQEKILKKIGELDPSFKISRIQ